MKKVVNPPSKRKDVLASGHAVESYGNSGIKVTQSEWDRIFGPPTKPRKKKA